MTDNPKSLGAAASVLPSSSRKTPFVHDTGEKCPVPSFKYKMSGSPYSRIELSNGLTLYRPINSVPATGFPSTAMMIGLPSTTCRVKRVFGSSPSAVGELLSATYRSRVPFPSTSPKAIVVAPYFLTSPRSVAS